MLKIALGFTTGALVGIGGTFIAFVMTAVILEDSPELLETLSKRANG